MKNHHLAELVPGTVAILLILLGGWFYWYQWRPASIRQRCSDQLDQKIEKAEKTLYITQTQDFYQSCLHSEGLE